MVSLVFSPESEGRKGISLGAYLERERLRQHMTQRGVAAALHMSTSGYEKIENGQRIPHPGTLNALARLFEMPLIRRRVLWSIATGDDLAVSAAAGGPEFDRIWNTPCPREVLLDDTALMRDPDTGAVTEYQIDVLRWVFPHRDVELFSLTPRYPDPATADPDTSDIVLW
ncbi:hypothetical protein NS506_01310 [Nocardia seriolae]|uniref:HTH cro/C1-type domain-containing protein n=1 Tax=Nocardia seriolae TaxID=37332 RepID=A0ABC9YN45_9NOCA|nr:hypothetical protein NS506_01310 [Nocardia seriolae]GEM22466.1 hypothetical protein NS2_07050 [Nocardia seriolae NBRC 15557]OJF78072.1 hypothetical protein NS14008_01170 [Nocardia seriolae]BEK91503.1 hypothetical protein NSERKGN1266_74540 [Nocardia seriolae]BEK99672.1 hypothetical protein NSER024013_75780 [Nocardia seriolae]